MQILAKQVHALLNRELADALRVAHFSRIRGSSFAWTREESGEHLTLWAQCDKYGWDVLWGSTFTLELQLAPTAGIATGGIAHRYRFAHMLDASQLEDLRLRNNKVIQELPGSVSGSAVDYLEPDGTRTTIVGFRPISEPYVDGVDVWMHYYTVEHVLGWVQMIRLLLPRLVFRAQAVATAS